MAFVTAPQDGQFLLLMPPRRTGTRSNGMWPEVLRCFAKAREGWAEEVREFRFSFSLRPSNSTGLAGPALPGGLNWVETFSGDVVNVAATRGLEAMMKIISTPHTAMVVSRTRRRARGLRRWLRKESCWAGASCAMQPA